MSADFTKVYKGFFEGSFRDEAPFTKLLFLAMMLHADENGIVRGAPSFWSAYTNISQDDVKEALERLLSPDPDSASPDEEGRRIIPWGDGANCWNIVNYRKYYEKSRNQERAEYKREWDRKNSETRHKTSSKRQNPTEPDRPDPENENENERKGKSVNTHAHARFSDSRELGQEPVPEAQAEPKVPSYRERIFPVPDSESAWMEFQRRYPEPPGGNWGRAKGQLNHLLSRNDVWLKPILEGVTRYREFLEHTGSIGTQYVKSPERFLIDRMWESPWTLPESRAPVGEPTQNWKEELRRSREAKGA